MSWAIQTAACSGSAPSRSLRTECEGLKGVGGGAARAAHLARGPAHVASLMIAAGVNPKALSTYMGHANISITLDRNGHLMPWNEAEAAALLDG